ncbi:MAG: cupin domain-containing protein [Desulfovibrio sp.]|nr:cupin domain-containing protein [Desulfovibrio sp.]
MIRRKSDVPYAEATMFGGPGQLHMNKVLNPDEFFNKGRLFNKCVLHPGEGIGLHPHKNEFEVYYFLSGKGLYNDNGTEQEVSSGDITICYSGEKHGVLNNSDQDLVFMALILFS